MEKCAFLLDCDPRWKWKDDYKWEEWMPYYFITFKIERISQIWNKVSFIIIYHYLYFNRKSNWDLFYIKDLTKIGAIKAETSKKCYKYNIKYLNYFMFEVQPLRGA